MDSWWAWRRTERHSPRKPRPSRSRSSSPSTPSNGQGPPRTKKLRGAFLAVGVCVLTRTTEHEVGARPEFDLADWQPMSVSRISGVSGVSSVGNALVIRGPRGAVEPGRKLPLARSYDVLRWFSTGSRRPLTLSSDRLG